MLKSGIPIEVSTAISQVERNKLSPLSSDMSWMTKESRKLQLPPMKLSDGSDYEGEWNIKGEMDGQGTLTQVNGARYEGSF